MAGARSLIRRAGPALAAIMLLLLPGGCGRLFSHAGSGHHRLDRFRSGQCRPGDPLDGVYLPFRLQVKSRCVTVRGRVDCVRREPDGDVHIRLPLNPAYRLLLTAANPYKRSPGHPGPHLVPEISPQNDKHPFTVNTATPATPVYTKGPKPS